ncbi:MAG: TetR/AcrR family transcriptional regulator [Solirubrobacteraceae bacterium]
MTTAGAGGANQSPLAAIQRSRMLIAAEQVACDEGAANLSVAKVVERAGVSRRTFYEGFSDIHDCLLAVLRYSLQEVRERVLPAYEAAGASWRGRIRAALGELLLLFDERADLANLLVVQWPLAGPTAAAQRAQLLSVLVEVVGDGARGEDGPARGSQGAIVAEGIVGGVLAILHRRISEQDDGRARLTELTSPLMSTIVLPYRGDAAARAELARPAPRARGRRVATIENPLRHLGLRLTQRTVSVIAALADAPGSSNRAVADAAGIHDQGQASKLLMRLQRAGVLVNDKAGVRLSGEPNTWRLTGLGEAIARSLTNGRSVEAAPPSRAPESDPEPGEPGAGPQRARGRVTTTKRSYNNA